MPSSEVKVSSTTAVSSAVATTSKSLFPSKASAIGTTLSTSFTAAPDTAPSESGAKGSVAGTTGSNGGKTGGTDTGGTNGTNGLTQTSPVQSTGAKIGLGIGVAGTFPRLITQHEN